MFGVFLVVIITVGNTGKCLHLEVVKPNFVVKYADSCYYCCNSKEEGNEIQEALNCEMSLQNQPTTLKDITL